jgi:TolA-binding protein
VKTVLIVVAFVVGLLLIRGLPWAMMKFEKARGSGAFSDFNEPVQGYMLLRTDKASPEDYERWKAEAALDTPGSGIALFSAAMYEFHVLGDHASALARFEKLLRDRPDSPWRPAAMFESGVCRLVGGYGVEGVDVLFAFCQAYPDSWRSPAALEYIARYYEEAGQTEKALAARQRVATEYPGSPQARRIEEAQAAVVATTAPAVRERGR